MSDTPRSGRSKKKSTLSKLADKKGRGHLNISDDSDENSPRNSQRDRHRYNDDDDDDEPYMHRSRYSNQSSGSYPRYPIDAKVQIANDRDSDDDEESDEGVEVSGRSAGNRSTRLPSDGTLNRLRSLNMETSLNRYGDRSSLDHKGEKRFRDQNSDGDEMDRDSSRTRYRKQHVASPDSEEQDSDDYTLSRTKRTPEAMRRSLGATTSSSHRMDVDDYDTPDYDPRNYSSSRKGPSALNTSGINDDLKRYQAMLERTDRNSDDDMMERREMADNVPDLGHRFSPPRHSALSPTPPMQRRDYHNDSIGYSNSSMKGIGRPWSAAEKAGNYDEMMSQRSYASSSVLPLISTKEARNRLAIALLLTVILTTLTYIKYISQQLGQ